MTGALGQAFELAPRQRNELVKKVIDDFYPRFAPAGRLIYVRAAGRRPAYLDHSAFADLGVCPGPRARMPDVVIHEGSSNRLILVAVASPRGPIDPERRLELDSLFASARASRVFVTVFRSRRAMAKHFCRISWGTHVWLAEAPDHMIHLNGRRMRPSGS